MNNNKILKFVNPIRSLKLRVFVVIMLAIIIPALASSIFIVNVTTKNYLKNRIDSFKANNTMLKNNIINNNYLDQSNENIDIVDAQIEQLAKEYNCRIQVVNSRYVIIKDSNSSEKGKTCISENVIKSFKGETVQVDSKSHNYIEFAIPITSTVSDGEGETKTTVIGSLYINYSTADAVDYKDYIVRNVAIADVLVLIFALFASWLCAVMFTKPIKRIGISIEEIAKGNMEEEKDYREVMDISNEFRQLVNKLNTQEKSRQEFVSNVSHELKTPITSMKVLADSLLGQQGLPEELYQEFLHDISKEIDRENDIITDLLALVRMEKSESEINISSVNINEILEAVLKRLKPIAESKNIELIFESFRPVIADVDELKFASVATNLVENAIKYNNTDGTVTASLNSDHQYFYLKVTDTGIGISEENQDTVKREKVQHLLYVYLLSTLHKWRLKGMKRTIKNIVNLILVVSLIATLWGCGNKSVTKAEKGFQMYYVNTANTKLVTESYKLQKGETENQISEALKALQRNGKDNDKKAIPDTVTVNGYTLADGLLTVDFGESYNVLNPQVEVLCRTAVVCTLNQIDGVDYVAFTIGGVPYGQTGDDKTVTAMKASDFISGLRGDLADKNKDDFKLYFANKKGTKLKEYNLNNASYSGKSKEQFIVEQLIKGPQKGKYTATLTSDTELISVATAGNICYVDFGDNFLTEQSTVSNKLVIYSIVNSLLELDNIHKVQISVEGDSALKYHDDISLAEPFIRNLDLVEQKNK